MTAIFKRECKSYFINMSGYLFIAIILLFSGVFVTITNFAGRYPEFEMALKNMLFVFLLIIPILTMRSIADDKHSKTDALLYSIPLKMSSIVIGKYLAMVVLLLIPILIMSIYPLILSAFGNVSFVNSYTGLLGLFLLGAALIAICMFMSSLTESQVIAAVSGFGVALLLYFMDTFSAMIPSAPVISFVCFLLLSVIIGRLVFYLSKNLWIAMASGGSMGLIFTLIFLIAPSLFTNLFGKMLAKLALFTHFNDFICGIFDFKAILYYLTFIVFFVYLTVQSLEKKRFS